MTRTGTDRWFIVGQLILVTEKEAKHLRVTSDRIRALNPDITWVESLENNVEGGEILDAFISRFGRLQDTLGDKFLPALLSASQEKTGSQIDNLLRAEKLGWIDSTELWIEIRSLRNRLVHEYMDSASDLLQALLVALESVELLTSYQQQMATYAKKHVAT
ncbi:MAG: hypothetical protein ACU88J_15705 [Gammaproteobacteria bacterium]